MQNQPPTLKHRDAKSPNFYKNDSRSFKKDLCKLQNKLKKTFVSTIICDFWLFLSNMQVFVAFQN